MNTNIENLKRDMQNLRLSLTSENYDETLGKMKAIDKQITAAKIEKFLSDINSKQKRLRDAAALLWECEQPTEDITTNNGDFHKVKVKKYPKLAALKYAYGTFENNILYVISLNGEKFTMYQKKYNGNELPTYTRPASFADFLELNVISKEDITMEQFTEIQTTIKAANEELKKQIDNYGAKMDSLKAYSLECINLVSKQCQHVYTYRTNE